MRVLVIRMSSIGDVILTTPVLNELKKKYPDMIIDFVVLKQFKDSISGNKNINELILFDKEKYDGVKGIKEFSVELKSNNYDLVIDLHSKTRSKLICKNLGVKYYRYTKRKWWKTLLVKLRLIKYSVDNTIIKNYFGALSELGVSYKGENLDFEFSKSDLSKTDEYFDFVVFAPGASKETKKWTRENFADLAKLIKNKMDKKILLIGGKSEKEELQDIVEKSGGICVNLAGELSLKESGALMSRAEFVVTNDSGPFHIARGVKTLSFVIFGPTDPGMFDYNNDAVLLYGNEPCAPCSLHGDKECPKGHFNCMKKLTADKVFEKITERLTEKLTEK